MAARENRTPEYVLAVLREFQEDQSGKVNRKHQSKDHLSDPSSSASDGSDDSSSKVQNSESDGDFGVKANEEV